MVETDHKAIQKRQNEKNMRGKGDKIEWRIKRGGERKW